MKTPTRSLYIRIMRTLASAKVAALLTKAGYTTFSVTPGEFTVTITLRRAARLPESTPAARKARIDLIQLLPYYVELIRSEDVTGAEGHFDTLLFTV